MGAGLAGAGLALAAGMVGGTMNALAGGGTFATMPTLVALGLPANVANATSNAALLPGAAASVWPLRDELVPIGGLDVKWLAVITFAAGLVGSMLLVATPSRTFDLIVPWLLLFAFAIMLFGKRAAAWLHARTSIGTRTLMICQTLLGIYGGYFGGGVGLIGTAVYGLLANVTPRQMVAPRSLMLAIANAAATLVFILAGLIAWWACVPMLIGATAGGWIGAHVVKRLSPDLVRGWTLLVTGAVTAAFFWRAYH